MTWTNSTQIPLVNNTQAMRAFLGDEHCSKLMAHTGTLHITNYNMSTIITGCESVWRVVRVSDHAIGTVLPVPPWRNLTWFVQKEKIPKVVTNILFMCWSSLYNYGPDSPRLVHFLPHARGKRELSCMDDLLESLVGMATTFSILGSRFWGEPFTDFREMLIDLQVDFLDPHFVEHYLTSVLRFLYECAYNADNPFTLTDDATVWDPKQQTPAMWARHLSYELFARRAKLNIVDSDSFTRSISVTNYVIPTANTKLATSGTTKPLGKVTKSLTSTSHKAKKSRLTESPPVRPKDGVVTHPRKLPKKSVRISEPPKKSDGRMCLHFLMRKYGVKFDLASAPPTCPESCSFAHTKPEDFSVEKFLASTSRLRQSFASGDSAIFEAKIRKDSSLQ